MRSGDGWSLAWLGSAEEHNSTREHPGDEHGHMLRFVVPESLRCWNSRMRGGTGGTLASNRPKTELISWYWIYWMVFKGIQWSGIIDHNKCSIFPRIVSKISWIFRFLGAAEDLEELSWIVSAPIDEPAKVKGTKLITVNCVRLQVHYTKMSKLPRSKGQCVSRPWRARGTPRLPKTSRFPSSVGSFANGGAVSLSNVLAASQTFLSHRLRPLKHFAPLMARTLPLFPTASNVQMKWNKEKWIKENLNLKL